MDIKYSNNNDAFSGYSFYNSYLKAKIAKEKFIEAIDISRKINYKDLLASNLVNIGLVEHEEGNLNLVFNHYFEALKFFEEIKSKKKYEITCINISIFFSDQKKI